MNNCLFNKLSIGTTVFEQLSGYDYINFILGKRNKISFCLKSYVHFPKIVKKIKHKTV